MTAREQKGTAPAGPTSSSKPPGIAPGGVSDKPHPDSPENLGHEGAQPAIKPNVTGGNERKDRGP